MTTNAASNTTAPLRLSRRRDAARGFSLIELLAAISIIALVIGITFPFINSMVSGSRAEAGLNTIGVSSDVARQWVGPSRWATDFSQTGGNGAKYSGTAAIFTPTRDVRITVNDRDAVDQNGARLELLLPAKNGYEDKDGLDYISIPRGTGLAGIWRDPNDTGKFKLIAPPFALAYNANGNLHFGDADGLIYYNGDYDPDYDTNDRRGTGYDPTQWTREDDDKFNTTEGIFRVPFEAIECVAGIIAYDLDDAEDEGYDFSGGGVYESGTDDAAINWIRENGKTVFFSPHTGTMLRDESTDE